MDIKSLIIGIAVVVLATALFRHRRIITLPFTLALLIAILWTFFYRYEYTGNNIFLFNQINLYPLLLWTAGLTQLSIIHRHMPQKHSVLLTSALYIALLGLFEAIAYHVLGIRLASNFTSLLDLGVIHAPPLIKIFYLLAGPAYILILHLLEKRLPQIKS